MLEKLKSLVLNDQVFYSCLIILVAVISFWLGRLSLAPLSETVPAGSRVEIKQTTLAPQTTLAGEGPSNQTPESRQNEATVVVGSRTGSKYHLPSCPGAKQIKPENLINFSSVAAAEAAGYKPAANCPQLQ